MLNKNPAPNTVPPLSTWDDQGIVSSLDSEVFTTPPALTHAELVHLRVRVIALENLVVALLAEGSERQREVAPGGTEQEAHRLGRRVTAHARNGQSVMDCVEAGIDWIMHADFMDERQADRLAASGIPCCPALTFTANIVDWGHIAGCSQARIDRFRRDLDKAVKNLSYAHRNGVKMMCGTDTGFAVTPYGEWHAREPELFVKLLGMSPLEAITCATRNSAVTVDGGNLGTLETGKLADLLVVDGDPLAEIRILQDRERLHAIYLGGQAIDRTPQPPMHRWPWERSLQISEREIYQSTVREHAAA